MQGLLNPVGTGKLHIGVDPRNIFGVLRESGDPDVDEILFMPQDVRRPQLNVAGVIVIGDPEMPVAESQFRIGLGENAPTVYRSIFSTLLRVFAGMAVSCLVKFVQGATIGTPGVALIGVAGTAVTVSNGGTNPSPDPGTWTFTVLGVPSASAVPTGVVQSGSTQTWTFTPVFVASPLASAWRLRPRSTRARSTHL